MILRFRPYLPVFLLHRCGKTFLHGAMRRLRIFFLAGAMLYPAVRTSAQPLMDGETWFAAENHVAIVGGASAERMQHFGYFEALLTAQYPDSALTFRNLAWSGDEVTLRPRPLNFGSMEVHLAHQKPDVVLMFFGTNESFAGPGKPGAYRAGAGGFEARSTPSTMIHGGLDDFREALYALVADVRAQRFNGVAPPRVMLISPAAQEEVPGVDVDVGQRNRDLASYAAAMKEVAGELSVGFIDLFAPTRAIMEASDRRLTFNGIHFNAYGNLVMAGLLLRGFGIADMSDAALAEASAGALETMPEDSDFDRLRAMVVAKNKQFFYRYRPVNGEYVYGRRRRPFGVENFPSEMAALDAIVAREEEQIHAFSRNVRPRIFPPAEGR